MPVLMSSNFTEVIDRPRSHVSTLATMSANSEAGVPEWDLGDRLVKARKAAGIKQSEMAIFLGLSRAALSGFENGEVVPRLAYLRGWADRCGVALDWLRYGHIPPEGGQTAWYPRLLAAA